MPGIIPVSYTHLGIVEVGYYNDERTTVTLVERPAADGGAGLTLDKDSVFLVTGAAGGITSAITTDIVGPFKGEPGTTGW